MDHTVPRTLYDQTQWDYTYMEHLFEHAKEYDMDLSKFKDEIESFQLKCSVWMTQHEESIYPQFARLLDSLLSMIHEKEMNVKEKID
jgi:hypothetical protein